MNENDLMHFEEIQSVIGLNLQTDTIIFKEKNEFLDLIFSLLSIINLIIRNFSYKTNRN